MYLYKERERNLAEILLFTTLLPFTHGVLHHVLYLSLYSVLIIDLCLVALGTCALRQLPIAGEGLDVGQPYL